MSDIRSDHPGNQRPLMEHDNTMEAKREMTRDELIAENNKLRDFKTYVHKYLDGAGVPCDPKPSINDETGCRIGCRLDWLLDDRDAWRKIAQESDKELQDR